MREFTLPSGRTAKVRAFTTEEQKTQFRLFHDHKRVPEAVTGFMGLCVEDLDGEPVSREMARDRKELKDSLLGMLSEDRKKVLLQIRKETLGDKVVFDYVCPVTICKKTTAGLTIDLRDVEETPYPHGQEKEVVLDVVVGFEDSEEEKPEKPITKRFQVSLLDGHAEVDAAKIPAAEMDNLTVLKLRKPRMQGISAAEPERWLPISLEATLSPLEVAALARATKQAEGKVDLVALATCKHCGYVGRINLVTEMGFFWPGMET